ncbi:hypothetical protein ACHAW6_010858 [Cyclotella cf. meneghiniana]
MTSSHPHRSSSSSSTSRMLNSELALKLKARRAASTNANVTNHGDGGGRRRRGKSTKHDDHDDPTQSLLLQGPRSNEYRQHQQHDDDDATDNNAADHSQQIIEGALHTLLSPLHSVMMACQSLDVGGKREQRESPPPHRESPSRSGGGVPVGSPKSGARADVASPSGMNYFPARNHRDTAFARRERYPVVQPESARPSANSSSPEAFRDDRGCSSPSLSSIEVPSETSLVTCAPSSILEAGSTSATNGSHPLYRTYNYFDTEEPLATSAEPSSPGTTDGLASDTSSLLTCAPSTVVMAGSTSATCPSVTPPRANAATTSMRRGPNDGRRPPAAAMRHDERRRGRRTPAASKNLLRLFYDADDDAGRRHKHRAGDAAPSVPWVLSPFHRSKRKKKNSFFGSKRSEEETTDDAVAPSSLCLPGRSMRNDERTRARGPPVDLDEVSDDDDDTDEGRRYVDDDTEAGYYSEPTDADRRRSFSAPGKDAGRTTEGAACGDVVPPSRKVLDRERVLSQLGMDVHEEDYCIEGEYYYGLPHHRSSDPKYQERGGGGRGGGGRWNYHQRKPSYVYDTGPKLDVGEVTLADAGEDGALTQRQQERRRRGGEFGENIKEGMKKINSKARQTFGHIISKSSEDEESADGGERGGSGRKRHPHGSGANSDTPNNNNNSNKVFGSKVLSMLRGHHRTNTAGTDFPPQIITVTPTASEDPDMPMTNEELVLMQRWQMARAKCRSDTRGSSASPSHRGGIVSPCESDARVRSDPVQASADLRGGGSDVLSIGASSLSDRTAHADNRLRQYLERGDLSEI